MFFRRHLRIENSLKLVANELEVAQQLCGYLFRLVLYQHSTGLLSPDGSARLTDWERSFLPQAFNFCWPRDERFDVSLDRKRLELRQ